jgi:glutamyl endopeptidase
MSLFEKGKTPQNTWIEHKINNESSQGDSAVFGDDERVPVLNTQIYPFQSICKIFTSFENGALNGGTGAIIGPQTILTAAHNIYDPTLKFGINFTIIPGLNGSSQPYGSFQTNKKTFPEKWIEQFDQRYDFGAIFLPQPLPNNLKLNPIGFTSLQDDVLNSKPGITICGYPKDKPTKDHPLAGRSQYSASSVISQVTPRTFSYFIDTEEGQSGSPLLYFDGSDYFACAIHNRKPIGQNPANSATRIIPEIFNKILNWKRNPQSFL